MNGHGGETWCVRPGLRDGDEPSCGPGAAILLCANLFLLFTVYYLLKTARESLILTEAGAELKSYSGLVQAMILLAAMPAYSVLASRLSRVRLMNCLAVFFAANLLLFAGLDRGGFRIGIVFYIWLGLFSVVAVTQVWSFATDLYSEREGHRIFPVLGLAASVGALVGAELAKGLFLLLPVWKILVLAAGVLLVSAALSGATDRGARRHSPAQIALAREPIGGDSCFQVLCSSRYLMLVAALVILVNLANGVGEFVLSKMAIQFAHQAVLHGSPSSERQLIGAYYASYFAYASLIGLVLQGAVVARVMRRLGAARSLWIGVTVTTLGYAALALVPMAMIARTVKIAENSIDYTLAKTALNSLFLRTSRAAKYKAKTVIDTFFYRLGDLLQALVVLAGTSLALGVRQYAILNIALGLAASLVVFGIDLEYRRLRAPVCAGEPTVSPAPVPVMASVRTALDTAAPLGQPATT